MAGRMAKMAGRMAKVVPRRRHSPTFLEWLDLVLGPLLPSRCLKAAARSLRLACPRHLLHWQQPIRTADRSDSLLELTRRIVRTPCYTPILHSQACSARRRRPAR
jgi:hypothetical protein